MTNRQTGMKAATTPAQIPTDPIPRSTAAGADGAWVRKQLDAILAPEVEIGALELSDLLEVPALQSLMDDFYRLAGIPVSIIDMKGRVLVGVGWQDICLKFHRVNEQTLANCLECDTVLTTGIPVGEVRLYKCKNQMWDVATPIVVAGRHLGNLFSGQFFFDDEPLDYQLFRDQAARYGFPEAEYLAALERVQRLKHSQVAAGMAYFQKLVEMISQIGYHNLKLVRLLNERDELADSLRETAIELGREVAERKRAEEELQKAHDVLEQKVAERTEDLMFTVATLRKEIDERERAERALHHETRERQQVTDSLRQKEQLLLQQSRLAAMGEMINNIAHQWRQPLNALGLLVQEIDLLREMGQLDNGQLAGNVGKSMGLINHMSQTIDDFRHFFMPDKEAVPFSVPEVAAKTVALVAESFASQQIALTTKLDASPTIVGFPNQYSQALLNILMNARDALLERRPPSPRVTIAIGLEGERSVLTVTDNAGGIDEAVLGKIFEPYFTTKGPDKGTGVGLFMSKAIVEKNMHGRLTAGNTADGAQFRIEI
jgi:signal transduction histidine kinase